MFPPAYFLALDIVLQLITAIVALAVAVFAFRGFRWVGEKNLLYIYLAFTLLAVAFFASGMTYAYAWLAKLTLSRGAAPFLVLDLGLWVYYILSIGAYGILAFAYLRRVRDVPIGAAIVGTSLFLAAPPLETVMMVLLFVIFLSQLTHYGAKKSQNSLIVMSSFLMLLLSHIFILFGNLASFSYVVGKILQLFAFISLLYLLSRMRGPI